MIENVEAIVSKASAPRLTIQHEAWQRINPKWRIVARLFVAMLSEEAILPRLATAETIEDLKAILFVDHYLSRMRYGRFRDQIQELLTSPDVSLAVIERYAAFSFLYKAVWEKDAAPNSPLYSVEAAAVQLGRTCDEIYQAILEEKIEADLYLSWTEIARLQDESGENCQ